MAEDIVPADIDEPMDSRSLSRLSLSLILSQCLSPLSLSLSLFLSL